MIDIGLCCVIYIGIFQMKKYDDFVGVDLNNVYFSDNDSSHAEYNGDEEFN